jgi:hypothetical protein
MGNSSHLIFSDLVSDDRQPLIELHGIPIDDLAIESARYINSELRPCCG